MVIQQVFPEVDLSRYRGEWVAFCENKIIAHNKDLMKIKKEINACKYTPTITKIPEKETLIF